MSETAESTAETVLEPVDQLDLARSKRADLAADLNEIAQNISSQEAQIAERVKQDATGAHTYAAMEQRRDDKRLAELLTQHERTERAVAALDVHIEELRPLAGC